MMVNKSNVLYVNKIIIWHQVQYVVLMVNIVLQTLKLMDLLNIVENMVQVHQIV